MAGFFIFGLNLVQDWQRSDTQPLFAEVEVAASGDISTVAGDGTTTFKGDGGPATSASLDYTFDVELDSAGNYYIADAGHNRIRKVDAVTGVITTVVGTGSTSYNGSGIAGTSANINFPSALLFDGTSNLYITEYYGQRVRRYDINTGLVYLFAGNGSTTYAGDGGKTSSSTNSSISSKVKASAKLLQMVSTPA